MSKYRTEIAKIPLLVLVFLALCLVDASFRPLLHGDVKVAQLNAKRSQDTLIVYLPGLVADGEWSVREMTDTWLHHGDVWLVNPTGNRFEYALLVRRIARMLVADDHEHVILIGSSLGAFNALDILERLPDRKFEDTIFGLAAVCTPSGGVGDIKQPLKATSGVASVFRFGPVTNATWGKLFTRTITGKQPRSFAMTYYVDQVNYVRSRPAPDQKLLAKINLVYLQAANDEIVEQSAVDAWTTDDEQIVHVKARHVSYDVDTEEWKKVFDEALGLLTAA
jgi:pimeloyl-ACP methyl ester carboxylesterase